VSVFSPERLGSDPAENVILAIFSKNQKCKPLTAKQALDTFGGRYGIFWLHIELIGVTIFERQIDGEYESLKTWT
jgi:hypothetical protein